MDGSLREQSSLTWMRCNHDKVFFLCVDVLIEAIASMRLNFLSALSFARARVVATEATYIPGRSSLRSFVASGYVISG